MLCHNVKTMHKQQYVPIGWKYWFPMKTMGSIFIRGGTYKNRIQPNLPCPVYAVKSLKITDLE